MFSFDPFEHTPTKRRTNQYSQDTTACITMFGYGFPGELQSNIFLRYDTIAYDVSEGFLKTCRCEHSCIALVPHTHAHVRTLTQ